MSCRPNAWTRCRAAAIGTGWWCSRGGLAGGQGGEQLVADVRGGDAGDLGVVVGGRDLDDVGADQVQPGERSQRGQQFPAGQAACLRGPGAGVRVPGRARRCRSRHRPAGRRPAERCARPCRALPAVRRRAPGSPGSPARSPGSGRRRCTAGRGSRRAGTRSGPAGPPRRPGGTGCRACRPRRNRCPRCSRRASKWTTATGPCTADTARSIGSATVWSPPSVSTNRVRSSRARAPRLDGADRVVDAERVSPPGPQRRRPAGWRIPAPAQRRVVRPEQPGRVCGARPQFNEVKKNVLLILMGRSNQID